MSRSLRSSAVLSAVALSAGVLAAGPAVSYQAPQDDVTRQTISRTSGKSVVKVTRTVVETPGAAESSPPRLSYEYKMDPKVADNGACQLHRNDVLVVDSRCVFVTSFFAEELVNPPSGRYKLIREGMQVGSWTYKAPKNTVKPPALQPAGCKIVGLTVDSKPRKVQDVTDYWGGVSREYTLNVSGKRVGKQCKGVKWAAGITYVSGENTGDLLFGYTSAKLQWSGNRLQTVVFSFSNLNDVDPALVDYTLNVSGTTPGWRANVSAEHQFNLTP